MDTSNGGVVLADAAELKRIMEILPAPGEGEDCYACHRPVPRQKKDDQPGPRRSVVSIHEPAGEEGTLESLMVAVVDKYQEQWPRDHAAMRNQVGLEIVGGRSWKFFVTHFALYATLTVPGLEPTEEG